MIRLKLPGSSTTVQPLHGEAGGREKNALMREQHDGFARMADRAAHGPHFGDAVVTS